MTMTTAAAAKASFDVSPTDLRASLGELERFLRRYEPRMWRTEQREHLSIYMGGLLSGLPRKSVEPIATMHGLYRRPLQHFVGAGRWSDRAIRDEMRAHIVEEIGDENGVLIIDGSGFHKQGPDSVGVARQWCGRLGKIDNCQLGVFLGYSTAKGQTLLDAELYLPEAWADDRARRIETHVPEDVEFHTSWEIADALLAKAENVVPHAFVTGDDEFGRPSEFRDRLADRKQRYLLEVPCNTSVRRPSNWPGRGKKWRSVQARKKTLPVEKWEVFRLRDAEKGPIDVRAFCTRVETRRKNGPARLETLLVMQTVTGSRTWYFLASPDAPLNTAKLVEVAAHRHHVEQMFGAAKGEVGLAHYEVRSWVGWHHHMTLGMLALWFLVGERRRLGKKLLN